MATLGYVLLSGGIDSATAVTYACEELSPKNVRCISVDYGQRHAKELHHARMIANYYSRPHHVLNLQSIIPRTTLTDASVDIPRVSYADLPEGISPSYVPFRNGLMLSALTSYVVGNLKDGDDAILYTGVHAEDAQNWAYADCTPEFIGSMSNAIFIGTYQRIRLKAPWQHFTKANIVTWGVLRKTPYHLSWSCLAKGTLVRTLAGDEPIELIEPGRWVWGWNDQNNVWQPSLVEKSLFQGIKEVFEVTLHDKRGIYSKFKATADHQLALREGGYARIDELAIKDRIMPATLLKGNKRVPYYALKPHNIWTEPTVYAHRYVADYFWGAGPVVHHGPLGTYNNDPSNLSNMTLGEHTKHHIEESRNLIWNEELNAKRAQAVSNHWTSMSKEEKELRKLAISRGQKNSWDTRREKQMNHVISKIEKVGEESTYDLQTSTNNFAIAAGIFVHNCYLGQEKHCGTCPTCRARRDAFIAAGVKDPTEYLEAAA